MIVRGKLLVVSSLILFLKFPGTYAYFFFLNRIILLIQISNTFDRNIKSNLLTTLKNNVISKLITQ